MNKRSEEAALKAYPPTYTTVKRHAKRVQSEHVDTHQPLRTIFQRAYEQADKDTLERVILWLKDNANKYIVDIGVGYGEHGRNTELIIGGKCWDDLQKVMEDK